jgi:hypothetical protein
MAKQEALPKEAGETDTSKRGSIVPTDSWLNRKGNAIYVNIPEKDIILTENKYGKRLSFVTSVEAVSNLVTGKNKDGKAVTGTKLGRFE